MNAIKHSVKKKLIAVKKWLDIKNSDQFLCGIGDILLQREVVLNNQLLLTSRLLDIESYLKGESMSFPFQSTISKKIYGDNFNDKEAGDSFKELIESYMKDGYHPDSVIICDSDMELVDGNHRMGLHIYNQIESINVRRVKRKMPYPYSSDEFLMAGKDHVVLSSSFIDTLFERYNKVQEWLISSGNTFCALVSSINKIDMDPITDLCHLVKPLKIYSNVKIESEKWKEGGVILFSLPHPQYGIKNGNLMSMRVLEVERIMRERYGDGFYLEISYNCLEGKKIFERVKPFLFEQHELF